jgi:hypothetical protein
MGVQPVDLQLSISNNADSVETIDDVRWRVVLGIGDQAIEGCLGIPGEPIDLLVVVDNSTSAGTGESGSNLYQSRAYLQGLITQMDQDIYVDPDYEALQPERSRVGVAASRVTITGTTTSLEPLTRDLQKAREAVEALPTGGDTELAKGVRAATDALLRDARSVAQPVMLLVLHDDLALTNATETAIGQANLAGIEVFLLINTQNIQEEQQITSDNAMALVGEDHYFVDPDASTLRQVFVRMTQGNLDLVARDVVVTTSWQGESLVFDDVGEAQTTEADRAVWEVADVAFDDAPEWEYTLTSSQDVTERVQVPAVTEMSYIDCNGSVRTASVDYGLNVAPPDTPTSTPTATSTSQATATFTPSVTPEPTEVAIIETDTPVPSVTATVAPVVTPSPEAEDEDAVILPSPPAEPDVVPPKPPSDGGWLPPAQWPVLRGLPVLAPMLQALPAIGQWLLLLLLLAVLIFLVWLLLKWLRNRRDEPSSLPKGEGTSTGVKIQGEPPTMPDDIPTWIKRLDERRILARASGRDAGDDLVNTVIIGLGPAGEAVLEDAAAVMHERYGEVLPDNVRLLQVDVKPLEEMANGGEFKPPSGLHADQWALLRPNLKEIQDNLRASPDDWPHLDWYVNAAPTYDRANGRLALFYDLKDGPDSSVLWTSLDAALRDLKNPQIRLVGTTFDDVSSGILVDVARLVHLISRSPVDVQFWLVGPLKREWSSRLGQRHRRLRPNEQQMRTLATLRELSRFEHNAPVPFVYVPPNNPHSDLRSSFDAAIVQTAFLFEQADARSSEEDLFATIADGVLALLQPEANRSLKDHLADTRHRVSALVNEDDGEGVVSALGTYTLRVPVAAMRDALSWRMVRDVLFEDTLGILPQEEVDLEIGEYRKLNPLTASPSRPRPLREWRQEITQLVDQYEGRWDTSAFKLEVSQRLNAVLNGEDTTASSFLLRVGALEDALDWMKLLHSVLGRRHAQSSVRMVGELQRALQDEKDWLAEHVYPLCRERMEASRKVLERLREQSTRQWSLDASLEWTEYRQAIRPWRDAPTGSTLDEPLLRLAQRFGWRVAVTETGWQLQLLSPPGEFVWRGQEELEAYAVRQRSEQFLIGLHRLAVPLAGSVTGRASVLERLQAEQVPTWLDKANPHVRYNESRASQLMGEVGMETVLVAPKAPQTEEIEAAIEDLEKSSPSVSETNDRTFVSLLRIVDWLPMSTLRMYDEAAWRGKQVPPALYVWRPEQIAGAVEGEGQLSFEFLRWLAEDEALLRLFTLGLIYGTVTVDVDVWDLPGIEEEVVGKSPCDVLRRLYDDPPQRLKRGRTRRMVLEMMEDRVAEARRALEAKVNYLRQAKREWREKLNRSNDPCAEDLRMYLDGIVEDELELR